MPKKMVPSVVVAAIRATFPNLGTLGKDDAIPVDYAGVLEGICVMFEQIPTELQTLAAEDLTALTLNMSALKSVIRLWAGGDRTRGLRQVPGFEDHPLKIIVKCLEACPDEAPSAGTSDLILITDPELRDSIRTDLSSAHASYRNGEWKASTVVAGSVIEALLLWALLRIDATRVKVSAAAMQPPVGGPPERWTLNDYARVSEHLGLIDGPTSKQALLSAEYRNLIHPGRALRLSKKCTRGTALAALAGAEEVIECLIQAFP